MMNIKAEDPMLPSQQSLETAFQVINERKMELLQTKPKPWDADDIGWAVRKSVEDYNADQHEMIAEVVRCTSDNGSEANIQIDLQPVTRH